MKYNELHKILRRYGCYDTGKTIGGHPAWYSPITGRRFPTSHNGGEDVKSGTLSSILKAAGIK